MSAKNEEIVSTDAAGEQLRARAIGALLGSRSIAAAARKVGKSERTLRRWLAEPSFLAGYLEARRNLLRTGIGILASHAPLAAATLVEIARDRGQPFQSARAHAASHILKLSQDAIALDDLVARVEKLERQESDD